MITEGITTAAEYAAGLGLDAAKTWFKDKVDEKKLRAVLTTYIEGQRKYNEMCSLAEEIDFQGLVEYISGNLLNHAGTRFLDSNRRKREQARENIISAAVAYSKADTDGAKIRVSKCISICLDIIRNFYKSQFSPKDYLLAAEIVDAITDEVQASAQESVNILSAIVNETKEDILAEIANNGTLFSLDRAVALAEADNWSDIEGGFKKVLDHISLSHPLYPDFGYEYRGGMILSKPLTGEAKRLFPPKFILTGAVKFGDQYYNDPNGDPLDYAYRHQIPITMEVTKAIKLLGEKPDPRQGEVANIVGNTVVAMPPEFPPAFSYVGISRIKLFGSEFEFRFMRTFKSAWLADFEKVKRKAEVLDDGDEIKLTFRAGDDKVTIDSLKIPEKIESAS